MTFLSDPISFIGHWLETLLLGWNLAPGLVEVIMKLIGAGILGLVSLGLVIFTIWMERKLYARIQDRLGPNRVGPWGIFQTFPDMIKIFTKEYITPEGADQVVYNLAPILSVSAVILLWAILPFASTVVGSNIYVGVLYVVAVGAIGTLSLIMAGWSSNNKYALLGAFRTVSQMVSYEVPMVIALLVPVILTHTMDITEIVKEQKIWFVIFSPLAAFMFFVSSQAEVERAPFDLLEAESELVAGYQTEYSGLKFGMFYVGNFMHAFTVSALTATFFLGGWQGPYAETFPILGMGYFLAKAFLVYFFVIVFRITMPRLRIDQMLNFNWKFLAPIGLVLLMVTALVEKALQEILPSLNLLPFGVLIVRAAVHLIANLLIAGVVIEILRRRTSKERRRVAEPKPTAVAHSAGD